MRVVYVGKDGLTSGLRDVAQAPHEGVRLTVPAREVLQAAGATVTGLPALGCRVQLTERCPEGIIVSKHSRGDLQLRMRYEPPYPIEFDAYWEQLDFTPCPKCGGVLVWYEAGYVPGYRVCAIKPHHHIMCE